MPVKKVTFQYAHLVWLEIRGEKRESVGNRDDGGLISAFLSFLQDEGIQHANIQGYLGEGRLSWGFDEKDLPPVLKWLQSHGAAEEIQTLVPVRPQLTEVRRD